MDTEDKIVFFVSQPIVEYAKRKYTVQKYFTWEGKELAMLKDLADGRIIICYKELVNEFH